MLGRAGRKQVDIRKAVRAGHCAQLVVRLPHGLSPALFNS
jgi:hypothetical protein